MQSVPAGPAVYEGRVAGAVHWVWLAHRRGIVAEPHVRAWLATQLAIAPDLLPLRRDRFGRPRLEPPYADHDVSWSHSGDGLLIALGRHVTLGVDLEQCKPRRRALELARRYYAASEAAWLARLPDPLRDAAFLRLWCAKEAVLKAHGRGLVFGLDKLTLDDQGGHLALRSCDPALGSAADWRLHEFTPCPNYCAAIAWRGRGG